MNSRVDVAVMIGSGVPATLQALGKRICWVVLVNGERRGTAFATREEALECQAVLAAAAEERAGCLKMFIASRRVSVFSGIFVLQ